MLTEIKRSKKTLFLAAGDEDRAELVLLGVPLDHTTSFRPGTRFWPGGSTCSLESLEE